MFTIKKGGHNCHKIKAVAAVIIASLSSLYVNAQESEIYETLSMEEKALIEEKKDAILYMLMEKDELQPYLDALKRQREEQAKKDDFERRFPFTQEDILKRRKQTVDIEKANNQPLYERKVNISEEPYDPDDKTPIMLNVASGNPSSLSFFDYEGNPWPIAGDIIGDPGAFTSNVFTESKNVGVFSITKRFSESVALISLVGLKNVIVVKLVGNENVVDSDKRIRLTRLSPLVKKDIQPMPNNGLSGRRNDPFFDVLISGEYRHINGIKELTVDNNPDRNNVYVRKDGYVYMRVRHELVFPDYENHHVSTNGFNLYKIKDTDTITMVVNGQYLIYTLNNKR